MTEVDEPRIKLVQQVIGCVLYYGRALDMTNIPELSTIASEKSSATENTERKVEQLLEYVAIHPDDKVKYHAPDMILNIRSDELIPSGLNHVSHFERELRHL